MSSIAYSYIRMSAFSITTKKDQTIDASLKFTSYLLTSVLNACIGSEASNLHPDAAHLLYFLWKISERNLIIWKCWNVSVYAKHPFPQKIYVQIVFPFGGKITILHTTVVESVEKYTHSYVGTYSNFVEYIE